MICHNDSRHYTEGWSYQESRSEQTLYQLHNSGKALEAEQRPSAVPKPSSSTESRIKMTVSWCGSETSDRVAHTIYTSATIVPIMAVIPAPKENARSRPSSFKHTVQQLCPFSMNAERTCDQLTAKLTVIRACRRMITKTRARRIDQHLLMTVIHFSLDVVVEMLLAHIYSTT